jgi:hypothetical protein
MKKHILQTVILAGALASAALMGRDAKSDAQEGLPLGTSAIYGSTFGPNATEALSTEARIRASAQARVPTQVWEALEHGESVECLDCIPDVEPLLYDTNVKTREISAWWLRRRMFGVFGPGEVYSRTITTLQTDADPKRRAYAASALGEFLATPGIDACATALKTDADPGVRAAAALALGRLNDEGAGALLAGIGDGDAGVKVASMTAAGRVNSVGDATAFTAGLAKLLGDGDAGVRKHAVMLLDSMKASATVASVMQIAQTDADDDVRIAAAHALGSFGDATARDVLTNLAQNDANGFVRDQATIALRRL